MFTCRRLKILCFYYLEEWGWFLSSYLNITILQRQRAVTTGAVKLRKKGLKFSGRLSFIHYIHLDDLWMPSTLVLARPVVALARKGGHQVVPSFHWVFRPAPLPLHSLPPMVQSSSLQWSSFLMLTRLPHLASEWWTGQLWGNGAFFPGGQLSSPIHWQ